MLANSHLGNEFLATAILLATKHSRDGDTQLCGIWTFAGLKLRVAAHHVSHSLSLATDREHSIGSGCSKLLPLEPSRGVHNASRRKITPKNVPSDMHTDLDYSM